LKTNTKAEPATEMPHSLPQEHCIAVRKNGSARKQTPHHMLFRIASRKKMFTSSRVICDAGNRMLQNFAVQRKGIVTFVTMGAE
jgi:hypothetical protein